MRGLTLAVAVALGMSAPGGWAASRLDETAVLAEGARASIWQRAAQHERDESPYQELDELYLGAKPVDRGLEAVLPPVFDRHVSFRRVYDITLQQVAEYVTTRYGVPVTVTQDAIEASGEIQRILPALGEMPGEGLPPLPGGESLPASTPPPPAAPAARPGMVAGGGVRITYDGTLRGFLDHVTARTNTAWRFDQGRVTIFHLDTRVFQLQVLPGTVSVSNEITNQSSGGATGGSGAAAGAQTQMSGGSRTQLSFEIKPFDAALEAIKAMLSPKGKVQAAPSMGQVIVTDVPAALQRVDRYVSEINASARRQVVLDVQVYTAEGQGSNGFAISWDGVWRSLQSRVGLRLVGAGPSEAGASSLGVSILEGTDSPFAGTRLFLDALAKQAKVRQVTSTTAVTLSGWPVPVQVGEEIGYIQSSQANLVPNVGQQITRTAGKVTSGFSMVLLPIAYGSNGDMLLQAQINLSRLRELRRLGSEQDGSLIESPLIDSRQTMNAVRLASGQTLVLTGLEQETLRSDASGVGSAKFPLLGGGRRRSEQQSTLVIFITPRML